MENEANVQAIIYMITNQESGQQYVGQTRTHKKKGDVWYRYGIVQRFSEHVGAARRNRTPPIAKAIREYGADCFEIEELERCQINDADSREAHHIYENNTLVPNGYNVQKQSGQVIRPGCEQILLKGIKKNGQLNYVRAYVKYPNTIERICFTGPSFETALEKARHHYSDHRDLIIEHSSLQAEQPVWWPYKEKIEKFDDEQIVRIRLTLFGSQNAVRVQIKTDTMNSWKDEARIVFGSKKQPLEDSLQLALCVVRELENKHGIEHELDTRLEPFL